MEISILNSFREFYEQGVEALEYIQRCGIDELCEKTISENRIIHGSYNYHNVLFTSSGIATTSFERTHLQLQVMDLYDFVRKLMEKNNWNLYLLQTVLEHYQKVRPLSKEEKKLLYIWMIYPEKFWKITNFYYNSKKTWMSGKNIEKLQGLQQQKKQRMNLLEKVPEIL